MYSRRLICLISVVLMLGLAGSAAAHQFDSDTFPVKGSRYDSQNAVTYDESSKVEMKSLSLVCRKPVNVVSPSEIVGERYQIDSFFDVFTELSVAGGEYHVDSFFDVFTELSVEVPSDYSRTNTFATEIVSMSLTGDVGGTPIMIRENPRLTSSGETRITDLGGGMYDIDSFFDVFTEISIDGGKNWIPSTDPIHLELVPKLSPQPHFLISSEFQWKEVLYGPPGASGGKIRAMTKDEWEKYMLQFSNMYVVIEGGEPYPEAEFLPSELYVHPRVPGKMGDGLVMAWGDAETPDGNYASAWIYDYGIDPDLSNSTIQITVTAPQFDPFTNSWVTQVSFGIQDINGNIQAWYWDVGPSGPIPWWVPTTITINTALTGMGAANPVATGYANNPNFDITQSQFFIVDENAQWVGGGNPVPPPGQTVPRPWNYWYDLLVTPNPPPKGDDPIKWSQPPVKYGPGHIPPVFYGWDEYSYYPKPPMVADDWLCKTEDPVTDIHWWGSFIGWDQPSPPQLPVAFHIGIWTNVPATPGTVPEFSHPGKLIWENCCDNYTWNFAGYDRDPRPTPVTWPPEACFQFNQYLDPKDWFYQEPNGVTEPAIIEGTMDNFVGPEPSSPRPELEAVCNPYKGFDDPEVDVRFGHTISIKGLCPNIRGAMLEIRMRAGNSRAECNDSISLQATGGDPAFAWRRWIGTGGPYSWCNVDPGLLSDPWLSGSEQTFVFDLDALPLVSGGTKSIINLLNQDRALDICVHDDTEIDYVKLTVTCYNVYWLSIAAIYDKPFDYPWGWKTRPHFFQDDAVRIQAVQWPPSLLLATWPPVLGATWSSGDPIEYPAGKSWDMAFELTTIRPCCRTKYGDINSDRIVDFKDFAIMASNWLEIVP